MRKFVPPDESAWGLPAAWWKTVHPRRGGRASPLSGPVEAPDDLPPYVRERFLRRAVIFDTSLLDRGLRHLAEMNGDPLDAAVALLIADAGRSSIESHLAGEWTARFGIEFVTRAVAEAFRLVDSGALWRVDPDATETHERLWRAEELERAYAFARTVRRELASASDDDYRAATEVIERYRTWPAGRIIASYLSPTRTDWVDADCAAMAHWRFEGRAGWELGDHRHLSGLLVMAASRPEHLDQLRGAVTLAVLGHQDPGVVATILDGVGPAATAMLADPFYRELLWLSDGSPANRHRLRPQVLRVFGATPDDDALRILLRDTLDDEHRRPGQLLRTKALTRYPVRALRMLAERDDPISRDLFGGLVLTEPRLVLHLPPEIRERAAEVLSSGGAGIGTGWAAIIDTNDRRRPLDSADDVKQAVGALAEIPTAEAFGLLVDRVDRRYFRPALLAAAKRDPALAAQVLADRAQDSGTPDPTIAELLRDHLLAYPGCGTGLDSPVLAVTGGPEPVDPVVFDREPERRVLLPVWLIPAKLPAVTVRDSGVPLTPRAVRRLCEFVALSKLTVARPEIAEVLDVCDRGDLAALAWAIFEQWRAAGYPPRSPLAMAGLAAFGDDTTVPALTALFPDWVTTAGRILTGMDVLAAIGSDLALTHLYRLSRKARTAGIRGQAEERLGTVAVDRGLRPDELADRIVPDLGLDADGRARLDYGPRQFTVGFDEQLQPWVADADGRRLARLPRPSTGDDPELAPAAQRRFIEMRKEARAVTGDRIRAVETAMATGRRWTVAEFRAFFLEHPLMWHLAHRLLWVAYPPGTAPDGVVFRVAEDRTFADIDDKSWELPDDAVVGVAHPWHFADDRRAWGQVFLDYAIIQPFPQIERELIAPSDVDPAAMTGAAIDGRKLFVLTSRGWRFGGHHASVVRDWPPASAQISFTPGYHWQDGDAEKTLTGVSGLDGLDPIGYSEVIRDLRYLTT
ncbi:DUF4132 domain-containing protein [Actinoplanes couchii]|uniref:DUF4132 domain-containing protein n=1 Tax=Actinoplanes couchii TaxID=403638 RepID=A0ABQ3XHY9_9ACTN|nr:DUF4132 domain-containing protein [Actinoplanes couchii]MDR6317738.1 hypothetical protein [Actinoplanes couchii]GID58123.1 hypothetical protein Aco03nite_065270 [Actinoplanes couchii]